MREAGFSRREFLKAVGLGAAAIVMPGCGKSSNGPAGKEPVDRPNIIIIMADDLGYGDIGCYGNKTVKTPNIDALAEGGMRFTDFHSNGPMCSPTRAALLTGRYQQRCGIERVLGFRRAKAIGMSPVEVTFAEVLKAAGYATALYGKWHTGHPPEFAPTRQGFDTFRGLYGGMDYHSHINRTGHENWWRNEELVPEKGYGTELITGHGERFIEEHKNKPFCLYISHFAVHFPWQGPNDKADFLPGVDNSSAEKKYGTRKDRKAAYKEMTEALDEGIGRIISTLRRLGLEEKTLLFFMSDNGGHNIVASNGPLRGYKGSLLEGGHRVPAIAYWPGTIKAGSITDETTMTMDLFPTMAALGGAALPAGLKLDGVNLVPMLRDGKKLPGRTLFWRFKKAGAVRKGPWKLLIQGQRRHLYNLADDIGEKNDLAKSEEKRVEAMLSEFVRWEQEVTAGVKWVHG